MPEAGMHDTGLMIPIQTSEIQTFFYVQSRRYVKSLNKILAENP